MNTSTDIISRTGYTGEDGFEIICHASHALQIWEEVVRAAEAVGGRAAGLGARDTLRLEAAMPLYGHELSEAINPIQAGLNFAVNLNGSRIRRPRGTGTIRRRHRINRCASACSSMANACRGKAAPCCRTGEIVGEVTSGTFSPTFERPIAMAYVRPTAHAIGTQLTVDIRGTQHAAVVVPLPFYERDQEELTTETQRTRRKEVINRR